MRELIFAKYQSLGNDFILIDNRAESISLPPVTVKRLCDRHLGIGADGVIFLSNSTRADFLMRIFNGDGTEASMCGNGLACLAKYIADEKLLDKDFFSIAARGGNYQIAKEKEAIVIEAEHPKIIKKDLTLTFGKEKVRMDYIDSGTDHVVIKGKDIKNIDIEKEGKRIRNHEYFAKKGANVNFIEFSDDDQIYARVYEKGVEAETLACGTGALAIACIVPKKKIEITFPGGRIKIRKEEKIKMFLSPKKVFSGKTEI